MKATGIVRRIDDLGRVVIPKEIRRTMRIREGDPLEIYTDREGEVIFKKYSPIGELAAFSAQYAETLQKTCSLSVIVTDRDAIIAAAGVPKKEYLEKAISEELEDIIESRTLYTYRKGQERLRVIDDGGSHYISCAMPILAGGDIIGAVCSLRHGEEDEGKLAEGIETKLIQTAAGFLARQMEA